jgi:hypothetical protein
VREKGEDTRKSIYHSLGQHGQSNNQVEIKDRNDSTKIQLK